ncbi:MAG: hypothetical protein A2749_02450 [Parcubacteria group bacterium RIFCSPHIGHO2_01_FULL_45_26]|nr:MAG: hypothetical protein A2749_02450 [Parcubacteria group bacterium RIFCSPHIGHO2_01_FULL_45_26]
MRLLIITQKVNSTDSNLGFFTRWILEFATKCEKITVICLEKGEYNFPSNVRVTSLGKEIGLNRFARLLRFYKYILKYSSEYDCVFVHMNPEYVILGGLWWRLAAKKIALWYTHKSVNWQLRLAEKLTNFVFTASTESFHLSSKKLHVLGHGIDTDFFRPSPGHLVCNNVITVGRITPSKKLAEMIKVVNQVRERGTKVSFLVAGEASTIQDIKYKEALPKGVSFIGTIRHAKLPDFYQSAKLFLNFSATGSMDKAVLEALSCGVPVLTINEAFKPLGQDVYKGDCTTNEIVDYAMKILSGTRPQSKRDWVVANHNLSVLIARIVKLLAGE